MKNRIIGLKAGLIITLAHLLISISVFAQAPQKMSYQAVIRNASNTLVTSVPVGMQTSILQGSATGTAVYVETQTATTNINGLVTIEIGNGTPVTGTFSSINWSAGPYFIMTETDPTGGTAYSISGTTQLMSVPYALYAETSGSGGAVGATGATGADGINGTNGVDGANGTNGIDGINGTNGVDGINGTNGIDGVAGATGATGATGANGIDGINGTNGIDGVNGTNGVDGIAGATGATGPQGPIGVAGTNGTNGSTGATGPQGPIGLTGANGTNGATGATGPQGPIGVAGTNGTNGTNGSTGATGAVGSTGATGLLANGAVAGNTPYWNGTAWVVNSSNIFNNGGNVGVGTSSPLEKLHVSDTVSPNASTVLVSGLSSTTTLTTNSTDVIVLTDVNGSLRRSNEAIKDAWYTTGNATSAVRNIGTTTNQSFQFIANNVVRGRVNPTDGEFVWGGAAASPYAGDGLCGVANATTPFAVSGYSAQNGSGIWGEIMAGGTTNFSAVQGIYSGTGTGSGVFGNYNGTSTSATRAGVTGIMGTVATGGAAVYGNSTAASGNQHMGVLGQYNGAAFGIGVYGIGFGGGLMTGNNDVGVVGWRANNANYSGYFNGNHVVANGTKSASVGTSKGNQLLYCTETPEVWFEDLGEGTLVNGEATINLDPLFLETVFIDDTHPMHVFIQMEGESEDVYVTKGSSSFKVKERHNGTSNATFSYRVMAKRLNFQDHRFGNDPVWQGGDTRKYSQYAPPPPVNYEENLKFQAEQRKNWKPTPMPEGFKYQEELDRENKAEVIRTKK